MATKSMALVVATMLLCFFCFIITITSSVANAQALCPLVYGCQCGNNLLPNKPGMTVICDRGGLTVIPAGDMPRETRYLIIRAPASNPNRFRFQLGTFNKFDQLEELHLTDSNALRAIGEDVFFELSRTLRVLNLTNNVIEYLIENNFRNLENLQALYLDNNYISGLNSATFNMLKQLRLLSLRNNYIRELPPAFSVGLAQLEVLDFSDNPLGTSSNPDIRGTVPESAFNYTSQLKVLNLHNTSLERLPYAELARFLPDLRQLDVGASRFCRVEDGQFNRFRALRQLGLNGMASKCQQFLIKPRALQGMTELQTVDLGQNHLNDLTNVLNGVSRLETLSLGGNNLQQLKREDFHDIAGSLIALDLSQNDRLALRPRMFQFLPNLQQLDLSRMGLNDATLPNELFSYPNRLKVLNASTNSVRDFSEQLLLSLPNLEILDLSYNMLQRVPEGLGASSTTSVPVSAGNSATSVLNTNNNQLRELYLNDNQLHDFPSNQLMALRTSSPIRVLALQNNPWSCNCGVFDLYNWITTREGQDAMCGVNTQPGRVVGAGRSAVVACPTCQEPVNVRNRALSALDNAHFTECRTAFTPLVNSIDGSDSGRASRIAAIIIASCIAFALLLLAILLLVWWHRNRLVSYYTREEKRTDYDESLYADTANAATVTPTLPASGLTDPSATTYPPASTLASSGVGSHYGGVGQQQRASRTESHV